jgi:hypothetical protein
MSGGLFRTALNLPVRSSRDVVQFGVARHAVVELVVGAESVVRAESVVGVESVVGAESVVGVESVG